MPVTEKKRKTISSSLSREFLFCIAPQTFLQCTHTSTRQLQSVGLTAFEGHVHALQQGQSGLHIVILCQHPGGGGGYDWGGGGWQVTPYALRPTRRTRAPPASLVQRRLLLLNQQERSPESAGRKTADTPAAAAARCAQGTAEGRRDAPRGLWPKTSWHNARRSGGCVKGEVLLLQQNRAVLYFSARKSGCYA